MRKVRKRSKHWIPEEQRRRSRRLLEKKRPFWRDLPIELVEIIMSNLIFRDQVGLHRVCKKWRFLHLVQPANGLPWHILWQGNSCKLLELYGKSYTLPSKALKEKSPSNTREIFASKNGWLLMRSDSSFFLYNPFTDELYEIPLFEINPSSDSEYVVTFSCPPTSPNCHVYVIESDRLMESTVYIRECNLEENRWTTTIFKMNSCFCPCGILIYTDGIFYCRDADDGSLYTFDIPKKSWSSIENPYDSDVFLVESDRDNVFLVESAGEILMGCKFEVGYKLDRSESSWAEVEGLGGGALFWGNDPYLLRKSKTPKDLRNMVLHTRLGDDDTILLVSMIDCDDRWELALPNPCLDFDTFSEDSSNTSNEYFGTSSTGTINTSMSPEDYFHRMTWVECPKLCNVCCR